MSYTVSFFARGYATEAPFTDVGTVSFGTEQSRVFRTMGAQDDGWSAWQPFSFTAQATGDVFTELTFASGADHCIAIDHVRIVATEPEAKPLPADAEQPFFTLIDTVGTFDAQQAACESQGLTLASITS